MENEAKQKALELMQRFNEPTMQWDELDGFIPHKHNAKTCALIAVDEILSLHKKVALETLKFYLEVKQEIQKL
jgi:hypothetical protein